MNQPIRIGTRDSELALWQAKTVQQALNKIGHASRLVPVKSTGDLRLDQPLYEMGITGIFTRTLDLAMIRGEIDIAVHSMKDVPTALPKGIIQAAVMKRASSTDILVHKGLDFLEGEGTIATGSLRRKAQWLNRYPHHEVVDLRGNVNTRLKKLENNPWNGAIFAEAGLERIQLTPEHHLRLNWMLPAPAQGAMLIVAKEKDSFIQDALAPLNHRETALTVEIERDFLSTLEGGCTAPIGALAILKGDLVHFKGGLFSIDGKQKVLVERTAGARENKNLGSSCAQEVLDNGGKSLMEEFRKILK